MRWRRGVEATTGSGTRLAFVYDQHDNVLRSTFGGATTVLAYDAQDRVVSMTDPTGPARGSAPRPVPPV